MEKSELNVELIRDLRSVVKEKMDTGEQPKHISFAMAYVAAELGLYITDNSINVFPVVLDGVAEAARVMHARAKKGDDPSQEELSSKNSKLPVSANNPTKPILKIVK